MHSIFFHLRLSIDVAYLLLLTYAIQFKENWENFYALYKFQFSFEKNYNILKVLHLLILKSLCMTTDVIIGT